MMLFEVIDPLNHIKITLTHPFVYAINNDHHLKTLQLNSLDVN